MDRLLPLLPQSRQLGRAPSIHFYDFEYGNGSGTAFGRDYFMAFPELFAALAGFQPQAPGSLRIAAEEVLALLLAQLETNNGWLRPDAAQRIATVDQAWAAFVLDAARSCTAPPRTARIVYFLRKDRSDTLVLGKIVPAVGLVAALSLSTTVKDLGYAWALLGSAANLLVGALWGDVLRRTPRQR
jgi:hypothetical protein